MNEAMAVATYGREPAALLATLAGRSHVVLDMDGTLYDERDWIVPALDAVVAALRARSGLPLPGLTARLWRRRRANRHAHDLFDRALTDEALPVAWARDCVSIFRSQPPTLLAHAPSLAPVLRALRDGGTRLALVSNGDPDRQAAKLAALGVAELFDAVVFCDPRADGHLKPSPWAWTRMPQFHAAPDVVHVGDDPVDEGFAAAGGAAFVGFAFCNPDRDAAGIEE